MEQNASKTKAICLTVIIEDSLLILAIFITRVYNIFFPIIFYSLVEIVCFVLVARQVKSGQASGKIIRQAKIGLIISCSIIFICSLKKEFGNGFKVVSQISDADEVE